MTGEDCSPKEIKLYTALFKEFQDVLAWSYKEILGIDTQVVENDINTYNIAKLVRQKIQIVKPRKVGDIK